MQVRSHAKTRLWSKNVCCNIDGLHRIILECSTLLWNDLEFFRNVQRSPFQIFLEWLKMFLLIQKITNFSRILCSENDNNAPNVLRTFQNNRKWSEIYKIVGSCFTIFWNDGITRDEQGVPDVSIIIEDFQDCPIMILNDQEWSKWVECF